MKKKLEQKAEHVLKIMKLKDNISYLFSFNKYIEYVHAFFKVINTYNYIGDNMKPIIGIISRAYYSETNKKINIIYDDIIKSVIKSKGIPLGIPYNEDIKPYLNICKGFILQGGDDINKHNLKTIKILKEKNVPTLGICLGMQEMFYHNNLVDIPNHKINLLHEINIKKDTLLHKIIKKDKILVNSRHKSAIKNTNYLISSISKDNIIESIEDPKQSFFLGLQWHPENLYQLDSNSKKIFDYFIKVCNN